MAPPSRSPGEYPVFRLCALTLAGASRIVPSPRRFEWRREWEAEVWTYVHSAAQAGRLTWDRQLDLFLRCLGAIRHATWLRGRSAAGHVRVTVRELAAEPVWASALVLTLGLTLGIAAAVFDLGWTALTRHDPDSRDDRVVRIWNSAPAAEMDRTVLSVDEFSRFRHANTTLEHIAGFRRRTVRVGDDTAPPVKAAVVTGDFFAVFDRPPALGRMPADQAGVVLGYDLWWTRFHGDPRIVGRRITIDGADVPVRGVAAAEFRFPRGETELWLLTPSIPSSGPGERDLAAIGLLRRGVERAEAQRELTRLSLGLQRESPGVYFGQFGATWSVLVDPLSRPGRGFEPILFVLMGASGVAVLVALASVLAMGGRPHSAGTVERSLRGDGVRGGCGGRRGGARCLRRCRCRLAPPELDARARTCDARSSGSRLHRRRSAARGGHQRGEACFFPEIPPRFARRFRFWRWRAGWFCCRFSSDSARATVACTGTARVSWTPACSRFRR